MDVPQLSLLIRADNLSQFESQLFHGLLQLTGTKKIRTTARHPQANGMVERLHRQIKSSLMAIGNIKWTETLPLVLMGIRAAFKEDIGHSPGELLYGLEIKLPCQFVDEVPWDPTPDTGFVRQLKEMMSQLRPTPSRYQSHLSPFVPKDLKICSHALRCDDVKKPLQPPYDGRFKVLARTDKNFTLEVKGKKKIVSIDRLKPAFFDNDKLCPDIVNRPVTRSMTKHVRFNL